MELFIDDIRADTDASTAASVSISLSVATITDPRKGRAGYTRSLYLPITPLNRKIFGYAEQIHARDRFNASQHIGRVEYEGAVLIEGPLYLSSCEKAIQDKRYVVHIIGASKEWARKATMRGLSSTKIDYTERITGQNIMQSWTKQTPVRFLPLLREKTHADYSSGGVIPAVKILSSDDYHPFIHVATVLKTIFAESGYKVESKFVDQQQFSSLYMSGNYAKHDVSVSKTNMDFFARRFSAIRAFANSMGLVYADPYRTSFTVGNIVNTADPSYSKDGVSYDDVFTNNGCFQMDDARVAFIPTSEVSIGFRYHIRYATDYYMKSRTVLTGFNIVYVGESAPRIFTLANPYQDRRNNFRPSRTYKLAIFDYVSGRLYQLRYTQTTQEGVRSINTTIASMRFSPVIIPTVMSVSDPVLYYRTSQLRPWVKHTGDWALYDGFIGETGTLDVELTLRSAPETISPSHPKYFDNIYFGGANPGMSMVISDKVWIKPVFYAQPTEGSIVSFADIAVHNCTQMDLINSLRQMFNLCFYTDNRAKTVRIEPSAEFYSNQEVIDWTQRVDLLKPITVEELGADLAREMVWCYASGDSAVVRQNRSTDSQMGRWSAKIENCAADNSTQVLENSLFTCALNVTDGYRGAKSASLMQVGDIYAEQIERTEDLNFAPKIVRYEGMKPLMSGQVWGWPSSGATYPKLAFHNPEDGFTLCFEDRNEAKGLHSHYDHDVRLWNNSKRVAMWLNLDPTDVESLSFPTGSGPDFRKLYRIDLNGEQGFYRLEEICGYNPLTASTKCVFIKHIP